jgi:hypothetical protein
MAARADEPLALIEAQRPQGDAELTCDLADRSRIVAGQSAGVVRDCRLGRMRRCKLQK